MTGIFFSDLDGTLIYSRARTPDWVDVHVVEHSKGRESSAVRTAAWPTLDTMLRDGTLIPVTTRTREEFARLELPPAQAAIVSNGAHILRAGTEDPAWADHVSRGRDAATYDGLGADIERLLDPTWARPLLRREALFYVAVTELGAVTPAGFDEAVTALAHDAGYVVSRQHRKLYLTPAWLTKEAAAAHLAQQLDADFTLAAGDATLDAGLLAWADEAMHPQHTADTLPGTPTTASGIDAGLELLTWAHSRIHATAA